MIKDFQPLELVVYSALLGEIIKIINQTQAENNTVVVSEKSEELLESENLVLFEI